MPGHAGHDKWGKVVRDTGATVNRLGSRTE